MVGQELVRDHVERSELVRPLVEWTELVLEHLVREVVERIGLDRQRTSLRLGPERAQLVQRRMERLAAKAALRVVGKAPATRASTDPSGE